MKVSITTLGCKVNQCESEELMDRLAGMGFQQAREGEKADLYVVNTCTVTAKTDYQSRQAIRRAAKAHPGSPIVVTGCYAEVASGEISKIPGVVLIAGNREKNGLPEIISSIMVREKWKSLSGAGPEEPESAFSNVSRRTRAFLKIQDGCESFCTYCIVPYARGGYRSMDENQILHKISSLERRGFKEVVLSGIHLGMYGHDLTPRTDLLALLRRLEKKLVHIERIRLSSIEPAEISDAMVAHMKDSRVLCHHFHVPLQSGDNRILTLMKRYYNIDFFRKLILKIVDSLPDAAIGLDVMVGFPGEGESEFRNTVDLISEIPVAYLHVFPYSQRPGTVAALMPGQVPEKTKKERAAVLRMLGKEKRKAFAQRFVGRKLSVLVESKKDSTSGLMTGFSRNYIPVLIAGGGPSLCNRVVDIRAERVSGGTLIGTVV
ncbi:MAG: tRNA (N(6)-L-threonylcarbamoyladenosine(37)-C(2))-methylthiotransferase MtaB [Syntrophales bacterium]